MSQVPPGMTHLSGELLSRLAFRPCRSDWQDVGKKGKKGKKGPDRGAKGLPQGWGLDAYRRGKMTCLAYVPLEHASLRSDGIFVVLHGADQRAVAGGDDSLRAEVLRSVVSVDSTQ